MCLQKDAIDTGSHGGACEYRSEMTVTSSVTTTATRTLDGMGGIEDHWESRFTDPIE